jgi:hypothetical protein
LNLPFQPAAADAVSGRPRLSAIRPQRLVFTQWPAAIAVSALQIRTPSGHAISDQQHTSIACRNETIDVLSRCQFDADRA